MMLCMMKTEKKKIQRLNYMACGDILEINK